MVYPPLGMSGSFVLHAPLSLLYASIDIVKAGYDVRLFDARLYRRDWQRHLRKLIDESVLLVGISVMTGKPIQNAVRISRFIKSIDPRIRVVWGGPHATFFPESILGNDWGCDYVISGEGSKALCALAGHLAQPHGDMPRIEGLSCRGDGGIISIPPAVSLPRIDYRDIPYALIADYGVYGQLDQDKRIFSIFSSSGCPYACSFCSSPALYGKVDGARWKPLPPGEVADHIEYLVRSYGADYIYVIDDDAFVDHRNVEAIIDEIARRRLHVKLGFRGARVNEILAMPDEVIRKLAAHGVDILHIGAESGSDRILQLLNKNISVRDIIDANKKLAKHPQITAAYNVMMGIPGETVDDLRATRDLMLRLIEDNPGCIIFPPNKYRPVPHTELFDLARRKWGIAFPSRIEDWVEIEVEGDFSYPWYSDRMRKYCDLLLIGSYFVDDKVNKVTSGKSFFYRLLKIINALYRPFAQLRMRHGIYQGLVEYRIYRLLKGFLS